MLQWYVNREIPDVRIGLRKGRGTRDQIANICWIIEKAAELIKKSASLTTWKPLTVWITTNWKILKEMGMPGHFTCLLRNCMQIKKQQLEQNKEQWTGSKLGKESVKAVYCHPAYLTSMQSISCEMPGWMNHNLESRLPGEMLTTSEMQMTPL